MSTNQISALLTHARENRHVAEVLRTATNEDELAQRLATYGASAPSHLFDQGPTYVADLSDADLESMAANTSYSKNCPTYRTCGAASPCVRTC